MKFRFAIECDDLAPDALDKKVEFILNAHNMSFKVVTLWHPESLKLIFFLFNNKESLENEQHSVANIFKEALNIHEQPDQIFYKKQLPLNSHGKIDRKSILKQLNSSSSSSTTQTPLKIFENFLSNVLGFSKHLEASATAATNKHLNFTTDISFLQAGGTSFQALSLASRITELLATNFEQRKLLEMLLDNDVSIKEILTFLASCCIKYDQHLAAKKKFKYAGLSVNIKLLWRSDLEKCVDAAPSLFKDKYVSVGSHSHVMVTADALTGEEMSRLVFNDRIECPVVFLPFPDLAVAGCYDGFLYGFDFKKGTILWRLNAGSLIKAKPLLVQQTLLIASYAEDYNVLAFDMESLHLLWKSKVGSKGIISWPLQITEQLVLFCCLDGTYALLDAHTGIAQWQQRLDSPIFSTAAKIHKRNEILLILAEVKGLISICRAGNGQKLATFQADGNVFSGLSLLSAGRPNNSLIIFGCYDKNVYCLEMRHCRHKQLTCLGKYALNAAVYATPIVVSKHCVLACSTKGLIVLLDAWKNTVLASVDLKAEVFSSPKCLNDKYIYVGSRDNYLYCFQIGK